MLAVARTSDHRFAVALAILLDLASVFTMSGCKGQVSSEALVEERCTECHTLAPIEVAQKTVEEWEFTVYRMIEKGARLNGRQAQEVIDYLSSVYGADSPWEDDNNPARFPAATPTAVLGVSPSWNWFAAHLHSATISGIIWVVNPTTVGWSTHPLVGRFALSMSLLAASVSVPRMGLQSLSDLCLLAKEGVLVVEIQIVSQLRQAVSRVRRLWPAW